MTGNLKQLALIATLVTSGAVSVDATIYDGTELSPREIRMEKRAEKIDVKQENNTVEVSLPWVDQPGIKVKYNLGEISAKERLLDRRNQVALIDNTSFGEGGVKFDIILNEKPSTNMFCYAVEGAEDYIFAYQGALTPQEIADGAVRPDNIVGSYAVYHKSLANNQYKTGKAFHIERPKVWSLSDDTNKQLATISYSEGQLCVVAPQAFLDIADYPVRIDPTVGYMSIGGTGVAVASTTYFYALSHPISFTDISSFSLATYVSSGVATSVVAIYSASSTRDRPYQVGTSSLATLSNTTSSWITHDVAGTYALATSSSWLYFYGTSSAPSGQFASYDTFVNSVVSNYKKTFVYPPQTDSGTILGTFYSRRYSLYLTYTTNYGCDDTVNICGEKTIKTYARSTDHGITGAKISTKSSANAFLLYARGSASSLAQGWIDMVITTNAFSEPTIPMIVDNGNATDLIAYSLWDSSWTKASTSDYIHISLLDTGVDDTYYQRYDPTTGQMATTTAVLATTQGATATEGENYSVITLAENGKVFMASADASDSWVVGCSTNCTNSGTWSEQGTAFQAFQDRGNDVPILFPIGGTNNIMLVRWDVSANQLIYNEYSATSSSWVNTATATIATAIDANTTYEGQMISVAYASTTGKAYLAVVDDANDYITGDHDIRVWSYASSTGWVALTNPVTNATGGLTGVNISINTNNGYIFCSYVRRSTIGTATTGGVYYKMSTDGGSTWSAENTIIATGRDYTNFGGAPVSNWQQTVTYKDATTDSFYVNTFWVASSTPSGGVSTPQYIEDVYFLQ